MSDRIFTISISDHVGFTDQLMQLALFYRIGTAAGLSFRLIPFGSSRSPHGFWDVFDLRKVFDVASERERNMPVQAIELSPERLQREKVSTGADLVKLVQLQLGDKGKRIQFSLRQANRALLVKLLALNETTFKDDLEARLQAVFASREDRSASGALRMVSHIRCGDAADIAVLPNIAYIAWGSRMSMAPEVRQNPFIGARITVEAVRQALAPRQVDCAFYTDGYERTKELLISQENAVRAFTPGEAALISVAIAVHDRVAQAMMTGDGITFSSGETLESLVKLLHAVQQADLITITGNQRMLPKFLAVLGARNVRPAVLLLEKSSAQARFVRGAGLTEAHAVLITLSSHGNALAPLFAYLRHGSNSSSLEKVARIAAGHRAGLFCIPEIEEVALRLEQQGAMPEALALYDWLTELTDGSRESYAGKARCAQAAGAETIATDAQAQCHQSSLRAIGQYASQASSLILLGRFELASSVIAEARSIFGSWPSWIAYESQLDALLSAQSPVISSVALLDRFPHWR